MFYSHSASLIERRAKKSSPIVAAAITRPITESIFVQASLKKMLKSCGTPGWEEIRHFNTSHFVSSQTTVNLQMKLSNPVLYSVSEWAIYEPQLYGLLGLSICRQNARRGGELLS